MAAFVGISGLMAVHSFILIWKAFCLRKARGGFCLRRGRREAERKREMKRKLAEEDEGNYPVYGCSLCIVHMAKGGLISNLGI